jgi:hypothetical protein
LGRAVSDQRPLTRLIWVDPGKAGPVRQNRVLFELP